jgi:hypothetical protein
MRKTSNPHGAALHLNVLANFVLTFGDKSKSHVEAYLLHVPFERIGIVATKKEKRIGTNPNKVQLIQFNLMGRSWADLQPLIQGISREHCQTLKSRSCWQQERAICAVVLKMSWHSTSTPTIKVFALQWT